METRPRQLYEGSQQEGKARARVLRQCGLELLTRARGAERLDLRGQGGMKSEGKRQTNFLCLMDTEQALDFTVR